MADLGIGVIGVGRIGAMHARLLSGQVAVPGFPHLRRQVLDHRLPDAIVIGLDVIESSRARAAD